MKRAFDGRECDDRRPWCVDHGARGYPALLAKISDPPARLWVLGHLGHQPRVAIVGSRACSSYGRRVATDLAATLAEAGVTVVSGLAWGIDAAAHTGTLEAAGTTLAVLPAGVGTIYPPRHRRLARRILERGALLAEDETGGRIARWHFPRRNRIIAGIASATVVVEAALRSGARITADLALDYGRDVLVVPGPITSRTSAGCNQLLAQGAVPLTCAEDVLELLPTRPEMSAPARTPAVRGLDNLGRKLLRYLATGGSGDAERLAERLRIPVATVLSIVSELELRGLVQVSAGGRIEPAPSLRNPAGG